MARNKGASVARGDYLHFLDDDDIALEGALEAFWRLRDAHPAATWLYGGYATTDNAGVQVAEFRPDLGEAPLVPLVAGEFIPLQSSLLSVKAFHDAKGFDPAFVGVEDRDLERRLAPTVLAVSMPTLVAQIRIGEEGSTTNWGTIVIDDQRSREAMLNSEIVRAQLRQVTSPAYWRGRIARAYFGSAALNARQGRPIVAASRIWHGSRLSGSYLASSSFWRGIRLVR